jgi:hypothetical protein
MVLHVGEELKATGPFNRQAPARKIGAVPKSVFFARKATRSVGAFLAAYLRLLVQSEG